MKQERLYSKESCGSFGAFSLTITVGASKLPDLNREEIREAAYKAAELIESEVMAAIIDENPENRKHYEAMRDGLVGLFPEPIHVEEIPNGYCSRYCCRHLPWFVITTTIGRFKIGWRKRVIQLDWSETNATGSAQGLFPAEDVTKGERMIHAWSLDDARRYINTVIASAENKVANV